MFPIIFGSINRREPWNPGRLPGTPREWLAGPDYCFTDGSASFTAATNQSLSVASNTGLQTGGASFWFSCWANHTTTSGDQAYAGKRNTGQFEWGLWHRDASFTRFQLLDPTSGADSAADASSATSGSWRHVFCWYDAVANTLSISVNGATPVTASNTRTLTAGTAPFRLGAFDGGTTLTYNGRLACAAFGKSPPGGIASVATAIRDRLYASGSGIVYADTTTAERTAWGLVSWWDLVRSGNFTDSHGSNNLTNNNGVSFGAGLPRARAGDTDPVSAWVDRWQGTTVSQSDPLRRPTLRLVGGKWVVRFDGVNDFLEGSLSSADVAHSVWAAYTISANGSFPMLVVTRSTIRELRHQGPQRWPEILADAGATNVFQSTAVAIDTPTRLIGAYGATGGTTTLYRGGVGVASDAADSTTSTPNITTIGARTGGSFFFAGDIASAGVAVGQTLSAGNVALLDTYLAGVM